MAPIRASASARSSCLTEAERREYRPRASQRPAPIASRPAASPIAIGRITGSPTGLDIDRSVTPALGVHEAQPQPELDGIASRVVAGKPDPEIDAVVARCREGERRSRERRAGRRPRAETRSSGAAPASSRSSSADSRFRRRRSPVEAPRGPPPCSEPRRGGPGRSGTAAAIAGGTRSRRRPRFATRGASPRIAPASSRSRSSTARASCAGATRVAATRRRAWSRRCCSRPRSGG